MKALRCAIYCRVSTDGQSCEMQLAQLRPYMELRQWVGVGEYVDEGISGIKTSRPRLNDLMVDVKKGKIDIVLVWKFDRMGRNTVHLVSVLDDLRAHNVEFCSFSEQVDTSSALGKCIFTIIAALAELERSNILMRSRAGIENAKRRGVKFGRRKSWPLADNTIIESMVMEHGSLRKAARALGIPATTLRARWREVQANREAAPQQAQTEMEATACS